MSTVAGTLTDAPRVSDVPVAPANHKSNTKLIAAAALAVTVLVGGWIFYGKSRGQAPAPAGTPPVQSAEPSAESSAEPSAESSAAPSAESSAAPSVAEPVPAASPSITDEEAAPAATTTASARSEGSSRPPRTGTTKGPPTKGPPTKKVNSTLGI